MITDEYFYPAQLCKLIANKLFHLHNVMSSLSANEIAANSTAWSTFLHKQAHASGDKTTQNATVHGLQNMCKRLGLTQQDHKLSLYWINTLEKLELVESSHVAFDRASLYTG